MPYACNCYYRLAAKEPALYFMSAMSSRHAQQICSNPRVAGTIHAEHHDVSELQSMQFLGYCVPVRPGPAGDPNWPANRKPSQAHETALEDYVQSFAEALRVPGSFFRIEISGLKFTNNRVSFGHKVLWNWPASEK